MSETQVKIKNANDKCMQRGKKNNSSNTFAIVLDKDCNPSNTTTQVFTKVGSNYKQDQYYLHNRNQGGYELKTASASALTTLPNAWEEDTTTAPAPAPTSDAPAPAGTPPTDPDDDDDGDEPWATRKAWILERWIWIVIGTGVGCFFFAIALYFFGRGGRR